MLTTFSGWIFNILLWGAIVMLVALSYHTFVSPILTLMTAAIALGCIAVISLFWPKF